MPQSHQIYRPVPVVELLWILFKNKCWSTIFHILLAGDVDGWYKKQLVWSTPQCPPKNDTCSLYFFVLQTIYPWQFPSTHPPTSQQLATICQVYNLSRRVNLILRRISYFPIKNESMGCVLGSIMSPPIPHGNVLKFSSNELDLLPNMIVGGEELATSMLWPHKLTFIWVENDWFA